MVDWEAVIGLEIHVQLNTKSKLFCACPTTFGALPNSHVCPVCTAQPGALPVLNRQVLDYAMMMGVATHCAIEPVSVFARKNYFYPDLPKGYQISQLEQPILTKGYVDIPVGNESVRVRLNRIHIEEDAGKLVHVGSDNIHAADYSRVDLNRACTPLIEIVSEPDLRTAAAAKVFVETIRQLVRYLGISDGNLEEGSLRCDANVSIRNFGETMLGTKAEVKNLNSFKAIEKAILIEIDRQIALVESGGIVIQETRHYNEASGTTRSMRSKEEAHDYRYFPEPDLVPIHIDAAWVQRIHAIMPELPHIKKQRFILQYGLSEYDAIVLTMERPLADFFEETVSASIHFKEVANWLMGDVTAYLNDQQQSIKEIRLKPAMLADMIEHIHSGMISGKIGKTVLSTMLETGKSAGVIIKEQGLTQVTNTDEIKAVVLELIAANPKVVQDIRNGKTQAMGFLVGQVMKATQGRAKPELVNELLKQCIASAF